MAEYTIDYIGPIVTREEARISRATNYFTRMPCKNNHISQRNTLDGRCLSCKNKRLAAWGQKNRERLKGYRAKLRPRRKLYMREWKRKNAKRHRELNKKSRLRHLDKTRKRSREYAKRNPAVVKVCSQNRRARELAASGVFTKADIERLMKLQKGKCVCCGRDITTRYHIDHVIPLSSGGGNDPRNLQLLTPDCNQEKHSRDPIEFMQSRGFLL